jgi:hypothetical protein
VRFLNRIIFWLTLSQVKSMVVVDSQPQETSASINSKVKGAVPIG